MNDPTEKAMMVVCKIQTGFKSDLEAHIRHKHGGKVFCDKRVFKKDTPVIPEIMWRKSMKE